jgi:hypothetical protein
MHGTAADVFWRPFSWQVCLITPLISHIVYRGGKADLGGLMDSSEGTAKTLLGRLAREQTGWSTPRPPAPPAPQTRQRGEAVSDQQPRPKPPRPITRPITEVRGESVWADTDPIRPPRPITKTRGETPIEIQGGGRPRPPIRTAQRKDSVWEP